VLNEQLTDRELRKEGEKDVAAGEKRKEDALFSANARQKGRESNGGHSSLRRR